MGQKLAVVVIGATGKQGGAVVRGLLERGHEVRAVTRKYQVEEHIAEIGVRATVLAPVYFMENLYFGKDQLAKGVYASAMRPTTQLAQVAVAFHDFQSWAKAQDWNTLLQGA